MKTHPSANYFATLNAINVSAHIEKKGGFSYLSWPFAVAQLRLADPGASWEVRRFDGLPFLATEAGVFVEVAVTVQGLTLSQIHPVLDARNRPIAAPTAFDINTSIQRCLVKAIALHGLGLYIYAGEDLPQAETNPEPAVLAKPIKSTTKKPVAVVPAPADTVPGGLNAEQVTAIRQALAQHGANEQRLLDYFGVERLEAIAATEYLRVMRSIQNTRRAA